MTVPRVYHNTEDLKWHATWHGEVTYTTMLKEITVEASNHPRHRLCLTVGLPPPTGGEAHHIAFLGMEHRGSASTTPSTWGGLWMAPYLGTSSRCRRSSTQRRRNNDDRRPTGTFSWQAPSSQALRQVTDLLQGKRTLRLIGAYLNLELFDRPPDNFVGKALLPPTTIGQTTRNRHPFDDIVQNPVRAWKMRALNTFPKWWTDLGDDEDNNFDMVTTGGEARHEGVTEDRHRRAAV